MDEVLNMSQLLREIAPASRRLARLAALGWLRTVKGELFDNNPITLSVNSGLGGLGFDARRFEVHKDGDFESAFDAITQWRADSLLVPAGDLMGRAAKRITKPGDLPVELPQHYQIVVNLKTANALGLKMPQSILLQADKVIE